MKFVKSKALIILLTVLFSVASLVTACGSLREDNGNCFQTTNYRIAMVTDAGDINDQSYNQIVYEACRDFGRDNNIEFRNYKPISVAEADLTEMIDLAVAHGSNIIVMPGYLFAKPIINSLDRYKDVKFIVVDVGPGDILAPLVGADYDYNPDNWNVEDYQNIDNLCSLNYEENMPGFLAGYAVVKLGYRNIGFLGGMAIPAVMRYGYGYLQGIEQAAKEMDVNVTVNYAYTNQFYGDADITAAMDTWYGNGCEVVFAAGGAIFDSVGQAAAKYGGKIIGVDVDQKALLDSTYGDGITITSAMKGVGPSVINVLEKTVVEGKWEELSGKFLTFGLSDSKNPSIHYCGLAEDSTQFNDKFTKEDYDRVVEAIEKGEYDVSSDVTVMPECEHINLRDFGGIK